ncbi:MAG: SMC family ATPase, partial [Pyrinomonadaceae bacterium]|nr:SMC family ATPase [Pyrinomonadaceae bacterium]
MHVTRVELENIKAYEHAEFTFEPGTTAIVGENGAGKTTILESIAWALFDTLEYSKDDFLRRGAKKGVVRVTFESDTDGRQYTVHRDTGNTYYIHDNARNQRLAEKKTDVANWLRVLFGVEPGTDLKTLFRHAIGVPQGLFTADFLQKPSERKAAFDRLLKVEEYRESAHRLLDTVNLIKERIAEVKARIDRAEGQLVRYDELIERRGAAAKNIEELGRLLNNLQREAEDVTRVVERLTAAAEAVNRTHTDAGRLAVEGEAARRRLEDVGGELAAAEEAQKRREATEEDYRSHTEAMHELQQLEAERNERDRVRREAEAMARRLVVAENELARIEDALESAVRARLALVELEAEIESQNDLERERERLIDLRARSLAAQERLARLDRELASLRAQHKETSERIRLAERAGDAPEQVESLESELLLIDNELAEATKIDNDRKHYADQRRERAAELARLQETLLSLERELGEHDISARNAGREIELDTKARELTEQVAHLRAEIKHDEKMRAEVEGGLCPILS